MIKNPILITLIFYYLCSLNADCNKANNSSRIVVAGGSLTEIVYLLGNEKKLVGVDVTSKHPKAAKMLPSIGYVRNLSSEGLLSLMPSLILAEEDIGPPTVIEQLNKTSVELKIINDDYNMHGILNKINCIASILDIRKNNFLQISDDINLKLKEIEKFKLNMKGQSKKVLIILMMRGTSPIVAGNNTSGHGFISSLGLKNVMEQVKGWKPVSKEEIILSDPHYVIVTKRAMLGFSDISDLSKKTGINFTKAGKNNNLLVEDGMSFLGFGPRTLDSAIKISKIIGD